MHKRIKQLLSRVHAQKQLRIDVTQIKIINNQKHLHFKSTFQTCALLIYSCVQ